MPTYKIHVKGVKEPMLADIDSLPDLEAAGEWITLGKHKVRTRHLIAVQEDEGPVTLVVRYVDAKGEEIERPDSQAGGK